MRLLELRLTAFGPFTDVTLDLDADGPALHVVHGRNEAGKSTALRAIGDFLYGVPERTPDAHLHPPAKLRVGARLAGGGREVTLVRRKGRKDTLLSEEGEPVDEQVLLALLGGVGREQFRAMFGLDHESLREGAESLVASRGDLGESLFDAGTGSRGIHAVLAGLEAEAAAIFKPQGVKQTLNTAIRDFKEAQKKLRESGVSPEAYAHQVDSLDEARARHAALSTKRRERTRDAERLRRDVAVLPKLARRRALVAQRAELGDVAEVSDEMREARSRAQLVLDRDGSKLDLSRGELARLVDRRAAIRYDEELAAIAREVMNDLAERLAVYRDQQKDLPLRRAELRAIRAETEALLARTDRDVSLDDVETLRVPLAVRAAIREHAQGHGALAAEAKLALERRREAEADLAQARERVGAVGESRDIARLEQAVEAALRVGNVDVELEAARAVRDETAAELATVVAALGLDARASRNVAALPVPSLEVVEREARRLEALERERSEALERAKSAAKRKRAAEHERLALEKAGAVPTEEQLASERANRNRLWTAIRRKLEPGAGAPQRELVLGDVAPDTYEQAVSDADTTADRLRREADRVARNAQLAADAARAAADEAAARDDAARAGAAVDAASEAWAALWNGVGVAVHAPGAMRDVVARHARAVELSRAVGASEKRASDLERRVGEARALLEAALAERGVTARSTSAATLASLVSDARAAVAAERARATDAREAEKAVERLAADVARLVRASAACEAALEAWREGWRACTASLGLAPDASPAVAVAVLEQGDLVLAKLEVASGLAHRIEAMEENAAAFERDVARLIASHAPALAGATLLERASSLYERWREAVQADERAAEIDDEIERGRASVDELEAKVAHARAKLDELRIAVGAHDIAELVEVETRAARAHALDAQIRDVDVELDAVAEGAGVAELEAALRERDLPQIRAELVEVEAERVHLDEEVDDAAREVERIEGGLEHQRKESSALDAADAAAAHLARVRAHARRYVRLELAATILREQIGQYRDANQGPVLRRTSELFTLLTHGQFARVRSGVGANDEPVLTCVRATGDEELGVEALSDGTRDCLYLALRLASLERHAERDEPLPLVLDDCLVHFDDERARAALEVLGEVAQRFQVLFFTHHARLVELAREAVPKDRLRVIDLGAIGASAERAPGDDLREPRIERPRMSEPRVPSPRKPMRTVRSPRPFARASPRTHTRKKTSAGAAAKRSSALRAFGSTTPAVTGTVGSSHRSGRPGGRSDAQPWVSAADGATNPRSIASPASST